MTDFKDVPEKLPLREEIQWSATAGLLRPYSGGYFRPDFNVTREMMAHILYRLSGEPDHQVRATSPYRDVNTGHLAYRQIDWAASRGLLPANPDGTFAPDTVITRATAAAVFHRSAGSPPNTAPSASRFADIRPGHPHYQQIHWMAEKGLDTGWADGTFRPNRPVTRSEMAVLLHRFDDRH